MSSSGAVILGDIAGKVAMLEIECAKCDRYGRYRVDRLIEQHGANFGLHTFGKFSPATARASIPRPSTSDAQPGSSIVPEPMI